MVEDMLFDPILAAKVLLRVKIPPHEELRIMWMWTTFYTNDDSGFSTGKSWTFALLAALRSILLRRRVSGILSKTFIQGQLIFANFDRWYNTSPVFRNSIKHIKSRPRLVHGTSAWVAYFRGGSECRVLPPDFFKNAERIRSERWHDAYLDEWTTYENFRALNSTIIGRATNINYFPDCPVRQNHIHQGSTPNFQHHPSYEIVKNIDRQIARGNPNYGRFTCNYRHVPDKPQWSWMINRKTIHHMQNTLPKGIVNCEIDGLWTKDSGSYYNSSIISEARSRECSLLLSRKNSDSVFVSGFDVARGGMDESKSDGDDFALSILEISLETLLPLHVFTIRKHNIDAPRMAALVHKYNKVFGFSLIMYDPGGGGLFVRDELRKEEQIIDGHKTYCIPITSIADASCTIGSQILVAFSRGDYHVKQFWPALHSDSVLINIAHNELKGAIERKNIILAKEWDGWENNESTWDVDAKRVWLSKNASLSFEDRHRAEMDLAVAQLSLVDYDRDKNQTPKIDSFGMHKFTSKEKKDSAYSLFYSYVAFLVYTRSPLFGITNIKRGDKRSIVFASSEI